MLKRMKSFAKEKTFALVGLVALALLYVSICYPASGRENETRLKQDCVQAFASKVALLPAHFFRFLHLYVGELSSREKRPQNLLNIYDDMKTYLIFVGHSRTGHTIVASLLDAHPEMIISDEQGSRWNTWQDDISQIPNFVMKKYKFLYTLHMQSQSLVNFGFRAPPSFSFSNKGTGNHSYNYHVTGQWQGQFRDKITVMGDKMGHVTASYFTDPNKLVKLDYIQKNLGVSLKIIHVIRNPYDVIATRLLRRSDVRDKADSKKKVNDPEIMDQFIAGYFKRTQSIERIRQKYNVLDIQGHELIEQPRQIMQKMCDYIGVTCEEDYIDACSKLLYKKPTVTRNTVLWTDKQLRRVRQEIEKYSFLRRYSMHSDP